MLGNKKNVDIVSKMSLIGIAAVIVLIIVVGIVSCSSRGKEKEINTDNIEVTDDTEIEKEELLGEVDRSLGVVKYVDIETNQLMIYDIEKLTTLTFKMDSAVEIKDAYGTDIALGQLELGDMVMSKFVNKTMRPEYVKIATKTWERKDIKNMIVDEESKTIRIGNEIYLYDDELVLSDNGQPFDLQEVSGADDVVVRGYKNQVWSIVRISGHGTITLVNYEDFIGGTIEISNKVTLDVESDMTIAISIGVQTIVVEKEGMAPFVTQVMINENENVIIDMSGAQAKEGIVEFIVEQEDVTLYLDDEVLDLTKEIKLDFGSYTIKAEKEGFAEWTSELVISQAYQQFKVNLDKAPVFLHIQEPAGAEIYLDGGYIGIIPIETPFEAGTHKITLRKDGYYTKVHNFIWEDNGQDQYIILPALILIETDTEEEDEEEIETPTDDIYGETE